MNIMIREALYRLQSTVNAAQDSEIPVWLRKKIVENVTQLVEDNASDHKVANKLSAGVRAIMDASSPTDDDPVISQILSIIAQIED